MVATTGVLTRDQRRRAAWLRALRDWAIRTDADSVSVVAGVARICTAAVGGGGPVTALLDGEMAPPLELGELRPPDTMADPELLGEVVAALSSPRDRRQRGIHVTPPLIADRLVTDAFRGIRNPAEVVVCDPAVGGGAFLLAAGRRLVGAGAPVQRVVREQLTGVDVDGLSIAAAETALALFAAELGVVAQPGHLRVADALALDVSDFPGRPAGGYDLVVGNPPFGGQLTRRTRRDATERRAAHERFGSAGRGYVDRAALFLLLAAELTRPRGRVVLIQPQSLLASADAAPVRAALLERATLRSLWIADQPVFDASVFVCAPSLEIGGRSRPVRVATGSAVQIDDRRQPQPHGGESWGRFAATSAGVPELDLSGGRPLSELVTATAGFRDHYYGLVPFVRESSADGAGDPLITTGVIDPARSHWGSRPVRFAGRRWIAPVVDRAAVAAADATLSGWLGARRRPKVLVATQSKIVEAVADPGGSWIPSVPTISVEPLRDGDLWRVAAVLLAPPVSVWMVRHGAGTGLTHGVVRISARSLTEIPLPIGRLAWDEAAEVAQEAHCCADEERAAVLDRLGTLMCDAYGVNHSIFRWWRDRIPPSRPQPT